MCSFCVFPQLGRYTKDGQLFLGPLGSTGEDTRCVVDDQISSIPQLINCDRVTNVKQMTWHFSQVRKFETIDYSLTARELIAVVSATCVSPALQNESIINQATGRCLEVVPANVYFGHLLILQPCTGQRWTIKNTMKQ